MACAVFPEDRGIAVLRCGLGVGGKVDVYSNEAKHVVENCERDNAERKYNEESAVCDQCS
jgi:hypothetical protein